MATEVVQVHGQVRATAVNAQAQIPLNERGEQLVASGLPRGAELGRQGKGWATMSPSAVAGLVVRPTTTAAFEIFNAYPGGTKSLIIDRLFFFNLVSTNVIEGFSGWADRKSTRLLQSQSNLVCRLL